MKGVEEMEMRRTRLMTTEFVTDGHPDKVCDQIADAIVDAAMEQDAQSRVAMEVTGGHDLVVVIGEMTTRANLDVGSIVRQTYASIGHDHPIGVFVNVVKQSPDIAQGVLANAARQKQQGAGDQGIMVGYAVNDGPSYMPKTWSLARELCMRMRACREEGILRYLRPDGKSQVTMQNGSVEHVTLAAHHSDEVSLDCVRRDLIEHVVRFVLPDFVVSIGVNTVINGTGRFVQGGFDADAGTTGRKLMVDNYGPNIEIGGGCYSGKDPSKVDRSAAYFCRMVAKSIVAGCHANEAIVKVAYAIGVEKPTFISVQTGLPGEQAQNLETHVCGLFDFRPAAIIDRLDLLGVAANGWRYRDTARAGHYGNDLFPWEKITDI